MEIDYKKIESKEEFISLIKKLSVEDSKDWENSNISDYLEAIGAWLESADGFYKNMNFDTDSMAPSWQIFADAVQAAKIYE